MKTISLIFSQGERERDESRAEKRFPYLSHIQIANEHQVKRNVAQPGNVGLVFFRPLQITCPTDTHTPMQQERSAPRSIF